MLPDSDEGLPVTGCCPSIERTLPRLDLRGGNNGRDLRRLEVADLRAEDFADARIDFVFAACCRPRAEDFRTGFGAWAFFARVASCIAS